MSDTPTPINDADVVARPGSYFRSRRYIITVMFIVMGAWFAYDGFVKWPRENAEAVREGKKVPYDGWDIPSNRILGVAMPPLGLLLLARWLYISRGEYRLSGNRLSVPGHPTISLDDIRRIDTRLWDRKGIAYLEYETPAGQRGRLKLDDFLYEQTPTDEIYKRVKEYVLSLQSEAPAAT